MVLILLIIKISAIMKIKLFGCEISIWTIENHPYPWRFSIIDQNGLTHNFSGIPNYCESRLSVYRRAWWRAKWLTDGSFSNRYN